MDLLQMLSVSVQISWRTIETVRSGRKAVRWWSDPPLLPISSSQGTSCPIAQLRDGTVCVCVCVCACVCVCGV